MQNGTVDHAPIGHNNPPDPIDTALAPFGDVISEAENWLDGHAVTTEAQMADVDKLIKSMKAARKAVDEARDISTKPLHEVWKNEIARWKPTQDDLDLQVKGLVGLVDVFKRKLAAEKEVARRAAWEAAETARREAEAIAAKADVSDIDAQREAMAARDRADIARAQASVAQKDTVKGMRAYDMHEITDYRAALHWIAANDKAAVTAFIEAYTGKNFAAMPETCVRIWKERRAV